MNNLNQLIGARQIIEKNLISFYKGNIEIQLIK